MIACSIKSTSHKGLSMTVSQPPVAQICLSALTKLLPGTLFAAWFWVATANTFNSGGEEKCARMEMLPDI